MTDERNFSEPASETSYRGKESDSIDNLVRWIESVFDCRDGPYQAWVENTLGERVPYMSLAIMTEGSDSSCAEKLRNALMHSFILIHDDMTRDLARSVTPAAYYGQNEKPILYWRYAEECRIQEESDTKRRKTIHKIYTRIAIPGADWSKIDTVKPELEPCKRI